MKAELAAAGAFIVKSINGWVTLEIRGRTGVKFLNICTHRGIRIRRTRRIDGETFRVEIPARDYKKHGRQIARKAGCHVHLIRRRGIGLCFHKYRKRRLLLFGIPVCLAFVVYFSSVVWQINITGGEASDRALSQSLLMEAGVHPGSFFGGFDTKQLAQTLLKAQEDKLSWVGIERVGTTLNVELATGTFYREQEIPPETPCDIIASKAGVISRIVPSSGSAVVQKGDIVEQGQLLVSGTVNLNDDFVTSAPERNVHAAAQVKALVTYTVSVPIENTRTQVIQTGRDKTSYILYLPGFSVKWPFWGVSGFESCSVIYTDAFGRGPFGLRTVFYQETCTQSVEMEYEEALLWAKEKASAQINDEIPEEAQILDTSVCIEEDTVRLTALCLEDIGVSSPIE
jgi:similar to stage IV sporulation protein